MDSLLLSTIFLINSVDRDPIPQVNVVQLANDRLKHARNQLNIVKVCNNQITQGPRNQHRHKKEEKQLIETDVIRTWLLGHRKKTSDSEARSEYGYLHLVRRWKMEKTRLFLHLINEAITTVSEKTFKSHQKKWTSLTDSPFIIERTKHPSSRFRKTTISSVPYNCR